MNSHLKDVLKILQVVGETTAAQALPGGGLIVSAAHKLLDKDNGNNWEGVTDLENGLITALNSLKESEVIDPLLMAKGIEDAKLAFDEIKRALKK